MSARAELFKYKKANGTVVYTDNLSQLPAERREFYNKQREEREAKKRELESQIGKEEVARREAEAKRVEIGKQEIAETERQSRMVAINAALDEIQKKRAQREASRDVWRQKMVAAREALAKKLAEFQAASDKYNSVAIKPDFSRLPGEGEDMQKAKDDMERLEKEVDALNTQVEETIPDQARKEGVPPGWLR